MAKTDRAEAGAARATEGAPREVVIPRVEERATVEKQGVEIGRVRVVTGVREREEPVDVALAEDEVVVERVPVGRFVDAAEGPRVDGETTIVPVYEERAVVETRLWLVEEVRVTKGEQATVAKTPRVVEEVRVGKRVEERQQRVSERVKRQDVDVEQLPKTGTGTKR